MRRCFRTVDVAHVTKIDFAYEADSHSQIWTKMMNGKLRRER